jgi:hypothetical protein
MRRYGSLFHSDLFRMKSMTRSEILIYTTLVTHGGKNRQVTYPQQKIADLAGVSLGSCKRALRKFEKLEWLSSKVYYQIKKYTISIAEIDHSSEPLKDQSSDLDIDHDYDLGQIDDPDQSNELPKAQSSESDIDHLNDPHVIENKRDIKTLHVSDKDWSFESLVSDAITKDEVLFGQLFTRWSKCSKSNWSTPRNENPLVVYRRIRKETQDLLIHWLEIKIIDSWLLMQRDDLTGRHWRSSSWMHGMRNWFKRQVTQGSRTDTNRLSARQKQYYEYSVQEMLIPETPQTELNLDEYRKKRKAEEDSVVFLSLDASKCTNDLQRQYIRYISNDGSFGVDQHWGNIVARAVLRYESLTSSDATELAQYYPQLGYVHQSIANGIFRSFEMITWIESLLSKDKTCGVDSTWWKNEQSKRWNNG